MDSQKNITKQAILPNSRQGKQETRKGSIDCLIENSFPKNLSHSKNVSP